jgi:hypothetical protein
MFLDVTRIFEAYREAARHLRNTSFSTRDSGDWDTIADFEIVNKILFDRMVLERIPPKTPPVPREAIEMNKFLLEPSGGGMWAMISRDRPAAGYWDHPVDTLLPGEAVLAFREYFDWDQHGLIDFRFYRASILESSRYPDLEGREALIETIHARIIYTE